MFDCDNQPYIEPKCLTFNPTYSSDEHHSLALDLCQGLGDRAPELGGTVSSWGELPKGVREVCAAKSFLYQDRERVAQAVGVMLRW